MAQTPSIVSVLVRGTSAEFNRTEQFGNSVTEKEQKTKTYDLRLN